MSAQLVTTRIPGIETASKILDFLNFPVGWKYGAGIPADLATVNIALQLNASAMRASLETNAFLGVDGEIRVTVYHRRSYLQFTVEENGVIEYVREEGNVETVPVVLNLEDALLTLRNFELELWHSSASSTAMTTIPLGNAFRTLPSRLPVAVRVFRSLNGIAPFELVIQSADM